MPRIKTARSVALLTSVVLTSVCILAVTAVVVLAVAGLRDLATALAVVVWVSAAGALLLHRASGGGNAKR